MNHLKSGMDALMAGEDIGLMQPRQTYDDREHQPSMSAYDQFAQEYPQLDEYGRKVVSGRQFKETMGTLAGALDNTSGQLMEGKADTGAGNVMDYMGFGGVTKKLTPSENNYFEMILGSPADKKELYELVPSFRVKKGVASVSQDDSGKLADYIDETYNRNEGMRLPPSFYSGDFAKKFNFDEVDRVKSKIPAYDDLMKQLETENLPAMLRKQSGFDTDPNFKPKPSVMDDDIFTLDPRMRNK